MNTSRRGKVYASLATLGAAALVLTSCGGGPGAPETTAASSESGAAEGKAEVTVYGTIADTEAELLDPSVIGGNAFEAVRRLRPRFLASRGASSIRSADAGTVHASLDGGALQSLDLLSRMRPAEIAEIRYLSASQAAQQFGTSSGAGAVLLIKTK